MERYEKIQLELLEKLKTELTKTSFDAWTKDMEIYKLDDELGIAYIALCESKYNNVEMALNILQSRYLHLIEECLEKVIGQKYRIVIKTLSEYENTEKNNVKREANAEPKKVNLNLMSNYTFETFVVGSNNKFAHAAALAVANSPAEAFNPVYIYGSSGLGKTHLLQAIGNHLSITRPELNIIYISAEKFTTEFIMSIKQNKTYEFKRKYRGADVLLIDDIQFFGRAKESQEEFFHTFNELYEGKKQIVITSDCEPSKLDNLQDRLKTRFQWNMIADIFPPDYETRVEILIKRAELQGIELNEETLEVIELIANAIDSNVRELEGALTRVINYSKLLNEEITLAFARKTLKNILKGKGAEATPENIKRQVSQLYQVKEADIDSEKRMKIIAEARQIAMYLSRELTDLSLQKIGDKFGGKHYTTVLHACDKIESKIKADKVLQENIQEIRSKFE